MDDELSDCSNSILSDHGENLRSCPSLLLCHVDFVTVNVISVATAGFFPLDLGFLVSSGFLGIFVSNLGFFI